MSVEFSMGMMLFLMSIVNWICYIWNDDKPEYLYAATALVIAAVYTR